MRRSEQRLAEHVLAKFNPDTKGVIVAKRLMAAAAAHVAVHVKGEVQLELQDEDGSMTL